jgi:hypothetical protein
MKFSEMLTEYLQLREDEATRDDSWTPIAQRGQRRDRMNAHDWRKEAAMLERFVYLVQTKEDYERPTPIEAHLVEAEAERRVDVLNAYAARSPSCPGVHDPDELWDAFYKAETEWKAGHPLGNDPPGYLNQLYEVGKVPLAQESAK